MPGPFPTPTHVLEAIKHKLLPQDNGNRSLVLADKFSCIMREAAPHDVRRFDMTLPDGRVYRVRVSDITPERG